MRRQEILNAIENLAYYKKFNNPTGLPLTKDTYLGIKCERYINLKATQTHKDNPHWLPKIHQHVGSPLIALGITNDPEYGMVPTCIFEKDTPKESIKPDYLHIKDFIGLDPSRIDALLLEILMQLQNEIIEDIQNNTHIYIFEFQGILLPRSIGKHALHLNFDLNPESYDTPMESGYQKTWTSYALAESLLLAQYEAIEFYMGILTK